jgi:hypothetical protein
VVYFYVVIYINILPYSPLPPCKRYKQLKLSIDSVRDHYEMVALSFRLHNQAVYGVLNGTLSDWHFTSRSPVFLRYIPGGVLHKYELWFHAVPKKLTDIYEGIFSAAQKAGYNMLETEDVCV